MHPVKSRLALSRDQQIARTAQPAPVRATDVASGARAVLPAVVAFSPLALMVGAAVAASDNPMAAWLSTWSIHGGAAQLITLDVVAQQPGWIAATTAGLLVQIRLSAYSTAMVADWRTAPLGLRLLAGVVSAAALVPALVVGCTVVSQLRQRAVLVAATAAGLSAVATVMASSGVAFVCAAMVGIVAGLVADQTRSRGPAEAVAS